MTSRNTGLMRRLGGTSLLIRAGLLVGILGVFSVLSPNFINGYNVYALMQTFALLGMVTLGLSLTMIAGEFDLSVGSMVAVAGLITLKLGGSSMIVGTLCAVGFGVIIGLVNAAISSWLRVSSLVVTVGTMMTLSGLAYWIGGGQVVSTDNIDAGMFLDDPIFGIFSVRSLLAFAAFALVFCLMRFTRGGRDIVAIGSRRQVAAAAGARLGISLAIVFVISAGLSALAGSLIAISLTTASPELGANLMLQAASAAIIGGVALSGGVGGPVGVMIGVFILATLNNGLSAMGANASAVLFANGLVLLAVVILDGRLARALIERLREHRVRRHLAAGVPAH